MQTHHYWFQSSFFSSFTVGPIKILLNPDKKGCLHVPFHHRSIYCKIGAAITPVNLGLKLLQFPGGEQGVVGGGGMAKNRSKDISKRDIGKRNVKRKHRSRRMIFSHCRGRLSTTVRTIHRLINFSVAVFFISIFLYPAFSLKHLYSTNIGRNNALLIAVH